MIFKVECQSLLIPYGQQGQLIKWPRLFGFESWHGYGLVPDQDKLCGIMEFWALFVFSKGAKSGFVQYLGQPPVFASAFLKFWKWRKMW